MAKKIVNTTIRLGEGTLLKEAIEEPTQPEIIINANGTAYKYPDGRLECFIVAESGVIINPWGSLYYGYLKPKGVDGSWTFPIPFIDNNIHLTGTPIVNGGGHFMVLSSMTNIGAYGLSAIFVNSDNRVITFKISAIGRWK